MTTVIYNRRAGKTGRPLGIVDVLSKVVETVISRITARNADEPSATTLEAAAVRRLADRHRRVSPGFAADLNAAADRHELDTSR